jgi:UDP-N-acetyl-D-galactosamine dehydrogenase
VDIYKELVEFGLKVDIYDPWANPEEVKLEYNINIKSVLVNESYEAIILAVAHKEFNSLDLEVLKISNNAVVYDTKGFLDRGLVDWRL